MKSCPGMPEAIAEPYVSGKCIYLAAALYRQYGNLIQVSMCEDGFIEHAWLSNADNSLNWDADGCYPSDRNGFAITSSKVLTLSSEDELYQLVISSTGKPLPIEQWNSDVERASASAEAFFKPYPSRVRGTAAKDAEGYPVVVYHGTARENEAFRDNRSDDMCGAYFTPVLGEGIEHAVMDGAVDGERPYILACYLDIRNPVTLRGDDSHMLTPEQVMEFKKAGFDSAISVSQDSQGHEVVDEYITFSAKQIVVIAKAFVDDDMDIPMWVGIDASRDKRLDYASNHCSL